MIIHFRIIRNRMDKSLEPTLIPTIEWTTHAIALWVDHVFHAERLTQAEAHILAYLSQHAPCTINDVHHSFGHKRSTLTSLLDRLEGRGWIRRQPHHTSRRLVQIELTESGQHIGKQVQTALHDLEQRVMAQLGTEDVAAFLRVIHVLQKELSHEPEH